MKYKKENLRTKAIKILYENGYNIEQLCNTLKFPKSYVYLALNKINNQTKNIIIESDLLKENIIQKTNKNYDDIIKDYKNNIFKKDILSKYKISGRTLYKILNDNNIKHRK